MIATMSGDEYLVSFSPNLASFLTSRLPADITYFSSLKRKTNRILDHIDIDIDIDIDNILTLLPSFHMTTNFPRR